MADGDTAAAMRREIERMKGEIARREEGTYYEQEMVEDLAITDDDLERAAVYSHDPQVHGDSLAPSITRDGRLALPVTHTRLDYTNGDSYEGEVVANRRHGKGVHRCSSGDFYDGEWYNDKRHGFGTMHFVRGLRYEGEWKEDKTHGEGMCVYPNGDRYIGDWQNDHRWGWGLFELASGDVYEGEWFDDIIEGRGRYAFSAANGGGSFEGEYGNGQRVKGRYVKGDGSVEYVGGWKNGGRHGYGTYFHAGLFKYKGDWADDNRDGSGECVYADGSVYVGGWRRDQRNGKGRFVGVPVSASAGDAMARIAAAAEDAAAPSAAASAMAPAGVSECYDGDWENDKRHGEGVAVYEDGTQFKGQFANDKRHGRGKCVFGPTGEKYDGEWADDRRHGRGTCLYRNGDVYRGEWSDGKRHGYGVMRFADGTKFRGSWEDDGWVQSTAEPGRCHVFGPGISRAIAGDEAVFGVEARDEDGNARLSGGDAFSVRLVAAAENAASSPPVEGAVVDNEDGTYVARYTACKAGRYLLHVTLGDGEAVGDSPYPVLVLPSWPLPRSFTLVGEGSQRGVRHEVCSFDIECRDRFGNRLDASCSDPSSVPAAAASRAGAAAKMARRAAEALAISASSSEDRYVELEARLELSGGLVHLTCGVEDLLDGTYRCTYTPPTSGFYRLVVRELRSGGLVGESPYSVAVREAPQLTSAVDASVEGDAPPVDLMRQWGAVAYSEYIALNASIDREAAAGERRRRIAEEGPATEGTTTAIADALAALPPADAGWDTESSDDETEQDKWIREHPDVPIVDNLEDIWRVGRLQKEKQAKERAAKEKRLAELREKLERGESVTGAAGGGGGGELPRIAQLD